MACNLSEYVTSRQLLICAKICLDITKPDSEMEDGDIRKAMRWIGESAWDTVRTDGDKPKIGPHGIGLMLSVTLLEFPGFYEEHGLSQFN